MKFVICRGCPASGKSTWAAKEKQNNKNTFVINRDTIRRELHPSSKWPGYNFSGANEDAVTLQQEYLMKSCAEGKINVIDDNTNLNPKTFNKTKKLAEDLGFEVQVKEFFDVHLHELLERNLKREWSVPEDVIHRMFRNQLEIQGRVILNNPNLPNCVIVDVDGTVAEMGKGESWGRKPFEWDKVGQDRPKLNVIDMVNSIHHRVIFLSGRDGVCFNQTNEWLKKYIHVDFELFMRAPNDSRPDCVVKEELLRAHILPRYNIAYSVDDRNSVVDHYRALGIEVWQVAQGRF